MVVLQIEIADFTLSDAKGQPPIAADRNAPRSGAVALKLVDVPAGRSANAAHVGRCNQHREDVPQPPYKIGVEFPAVVVFDEAQQAPVPDAPNVHACQGVRLYRASVKLTGTLSEGGKGGGPYGKSRPNICLIHHN